ncbi:hypothetical protein CEXT_578841 [Caerostris extrusa]|uniref:Uncharacterized protein n=1 Tax=Caerostris extrusa TaxID=172846 RepID=A0AAV4NAI8_CAEEX|nr:hypothetical protein CEXT_578841 [Caerostris extrusa]
MVSPGFLSFVPSPPPLSSVLHSPFPISMYPEHCARANSISMYLYQRCPAVARKSLERVSCSLVKMKSTSSEGFGIRRNP